MTSIGPYAFNSCNSLNSITIPDSVTSIREGAFCGCSSLSNIIIPNSVTTIRDYTFSGCNSLSSFTIPNSVTSIGERAFAGCYSLKSIIVPDSVTSIGPSAFLYCEILKSIAIPDSVTSIGQYAFYGCYGLENVVISSNMTSLEYGLFYLCPLKKITIPKSVTSIGEYDFASCPDVTICGYLGSYAQEYALRKNIPFFPLDPADYSSVDLVLEMVPSDTELEKYTDETVRALLDAVSAVDRTKTITQQAEVDEMAQAIEDAINALVLKADYRAVDSALSMVPTEEELIQPSLGVKRYFVIYI